MARNLLAHPYRRILLALLDRFEPPVTTRHVARAVCTYDHSLTPDAVVNACEAQEPADVSVEQLAAQLHHTHLPRLHGANLLVYDADNAVITDWSYPSLGHTWVTSSPVDELAEAITIARRSASAASD